METDLRSALERLAERGLARGADEVVAAAVAEVDGARLVPLGDGRPVRRTRIVRRLVTAAASLVAAVALVAGAALVYVEQRLDDIPTVDLHGDLAGAGGGPGEPMSVLVVGSDRRPGLDGVRADVLMVLRIEPSAGRAAVLSLPRDLWVPIAGTGREQRVNTALAEGPDVLVQTVQDVLGVALDHYVEVDFEGFERLVDVVGGVEVPFDAPTRDRLSGLAVDAGCVRLDGAQALALVRSRHVQRLVGGRWVADPTGDLGRIARQQAFLVRAAAEVGGTSNPFTLHRLVDVAGDHLRVDSGLDGSDLLALGRRLRSIDPADVATLTVPAVPAGRNGAAVLTADPADLADAGAWLLGERQVPPRPPDDGAADEPPASPAC